MEKEKVIKENNEKINLLIQEIIDNSDEEIITNNGNNDYGINETYKEILILEMEKILKIYHLEFPNLKYKDSMCFDVKVYDGKHMDAMYKDNCLFISQGIRKEFEDIAKGEAYGLALRYYIDENGRVMPQEDGASEKIDVNYIDKKDGKPYIITEDELIENDLNDYSDILYYYLKGSKYENFVFDVLPHEIAHALGFGSGIYEGVTENLSREISAKYKLRNIPSARKDLVKLIQRIEKVIGRDKLVQNSHIYGREHERTDVISALIDETIQPEERDSFKNYCETFNSFKEYNDAIEQDLVQKIQSGKLTRSEAEMLLKENTQIQRYNDSLEFYFTRLNNDLDEYISKNAEKLFSLGETSVVKRDQDFEAVISHQQKEIDLLNIIYSRVKNKENQAKDDFVTNLKSMVNNDNQVIERDQSKDSPIIKKSISNRSDQNLQL